MEVSNMLLCSETSKLRFGYKFAVNVQANSLLLRNVPKALVCKQLYVQNFCFLKREMCEHAAEVRIIKSFLSAPVLKVLQCYSNGYKDKAAFGTEHI